MSETDGGWSLRLPVEGKTVLGQRQAARAVPFLMLVPNAVAEGENRSDQPSPKASPDKLKLECVFLSQNGAQTDVGLVPSGRSRLCLRQAKAQKALDSFVSSVKRSVRVCLACLVWRPRRPSNPGLSVRH